MLETDAIALARSRVHPTLREGLTVNGKTLWFFEHVTFFACWSTLSLKMSFDLQIPPEWSCFNHTVLRWYPAANISLYRTAFLYEMYARGKILVPIFVPRKNFWSMFNSV